MATQADFSEVYALALGMQEAITKTPRFVQDALKTAGERMVELQKAAVAVRSGKTRDTISARMLNQYTVQAGPETWYAHFIEGGTTTAAPKPFVYPSVDQAVPEFIEAILAEAGEF